MVIDVSHSYQLDHMSHPSVPVSITNLFAPFVLKCNLNHELSGCSDMKYIKIDPNLIQMKNKRRIINVMIHLLKEYES